MIPIQIITIKYEKALCSEKRIMIEKLGEEVFRAYTSDKVDGKIYTPFELSKETYDSASSALYMESTAFINKVAEVDNQISDLLKTEEIAETLKIDNITES